MIKKIQLLLQFNIFILLLIQIFSCTLSENRDSSKSKITPLSGGTFRMMLHPPHSLDPLFISTTYECCIIEQIFNGLLKFDENLSPVPDLAESWSFSEDKTKITFHLKKGIFFHNGRELKAQDVVYSFNRIFNPSLNVLSTVKELLHSVEGVQQFQEGKADNITGFIALNNHTFQIRLVKPNSSFLTLLAVNYFKVIPEEESTNTRSFFQNPVGTGPFKFEKWNPQQAIILTRNENYFDKKAYLDSIIFFISEKEIESKLFVEFCDEKLDILDVSNRLDINNLPKNKCHLFRRFKLGIAFIGFNLQAPEIKNLKIRQAIAYAIDRKAIVNQNKKNYTIANGIFPAGMPGYQSQQKCYPFNPQKAKQLLDTTNIKKLQCWTVIPDTGEKYLEIHRIIQQNLNDVGIELEIKAVNYNELVTAIKNRNAPMFSIAIVAEIPLPEEFLANSFYSTSSNNFFYYHNLEVDSLIDASKSEFEFSEKIKLLQLAEQKIINDVPFIPLYYTCNVYLVNHKVHDIEMGPLGIANIPMEKIWKERKKEKHSG